MKTFEKILVVCVISFLAIWGTLNKRPIPVFYSQPLNLSSDGLSLWIDSISMSGYVSNYQFRKSVDSLGGIIAGLSPTTLSAGQGITITGTSIKTIGLVTPTISTTARATNTQFTPSSSRYSIVSYGVTCQVTNPLLSGASSATVYLEYWNGSSWVLANQGGNSSSVSLTVTVQITNAQTGTLTGVVPPNSTTRIRSVTTGTASVSVVSSFECNFY